MKEKDKEKDKKKEKGKISFADKCQAQTMLLISAVLHLVAIGLFFVKLKLQLLLGMVLLSNLSFFWSILYVLGMS